LVRNVHFRSAQELAVHVLDVSTCQEIEDAAKAKLKNVAPNLFGF
jgi:hypothetical protein